MSWSEDRVTYITRVLVASAACTLRGLCGFAFFVPSFLSQIALVASTRGPRQPSIFIGTNHSHPMPGTMRNGTRGLAVAPHNPRSYHHPRSFAPVMANDHIESLQFSEIGKWGTPIDIA